MAISKQLRGEGGAAASPILPTHALFILTAAYSLNFLDRQIVNIVAEPIKLEMGLSDKSLGLLTGLSFAIFYTCLGIPIARLAERYNRARIIGAAILIWSGFTALCGAAGSLPALLLARMGVGVGEAGCLPTSHSMIAEYVPRERLATAMATFQSGSPIGILLGLVMGGIVAGAFGWRMAFVVAGVPGVLLAVLIFAVLKDPARADGPLVSVEHIALREVISEIRQKPSFWFLTGGAAFGALVTYSQGAFIASFFLRLHRAELAALIPGMPAEGAIGLLLGLTLGIGGLAGNFIGGYFGDRGGEASPKRYMTVAALASFAAIPPFLGTMLAGSLWPAFLFFIPSAIINTIWSPPTWATLARLARPRSRATIIATALVLITLIGLGTGPLVVGAISDYVGQRLGTAEGLRWALVATVFASALSGSLFLIARRTIERDAARIP